LIIKKNLVRDMCSKHPEIDFEYKKAAEKVEYRSFPLLDYKITYKRIDENNNPIALPTGKILTNAF
jgi:hypothetical protein